eukprot:CAMPEP_0171231326 /NCGR_PEP_ID=MMETSP0790-20130122/39845_1 /TAXON_ID=2925 /ORGANISM="Alexandrium catenella, Strain OF101" /LENGTH=138 /DNA_ID=CAMNT_0011697547 /DNA_START=75 /DNA_END=491 /DNA_ORIENTATION=+
MARIALSLLSLACVVASAGAIHSNMKDGKWNPYMKKPRNCREVTDADMCLLTYWLFNVSCKPHGGSYCLPAEDYKCEDITSETICKDAFRQYGLFCNEWNAGSCSAPTEFDLLAMPEEFTVDWEGTHKADFDVQSPWH